MITLYLAPGACSRVPLIALEQIGEPYDIALLRFAKGEHRSEAYQKLNPKGKIPLLIVDGVTLSENVAILTYLAQRFPAAKLLPLSAGLMEHAHILSDLAWCASGLHPLVTRLRMPHFFCDLDGGPERVWHLAAEQMKPNFEIIEQRLADSAWWYSEWSLLDAYLFWVWFRVTGTGFDATAYPRFRAHADKMTTRPAVKRALAVEAKADEALAAEGLKLTMGPHSWTV